MFSSRNKVYFVAALTILSLIGIIIAQFYWVHTTYQNRQEIFNMQVANIMSELQMKIEDDAVLKSSIIRLSRGTGNESLADSAISHQLQTTINSLFRKKFADLSYEYGLVTFGSFQHSQGKEADATIVLSSMAKDNSAPLIESQYGTCKCIFNGAARIKFYFPGKEYFVGKQIAGMLLLSLFCFLIVGGCFIFAFVTIRKQKKLAQMKNDFINNMTHEFKTPIFSISLAAKALEKSKEVRGSAKLTKYTSLINEENKRLQNQVDNVLQAALLGSKDTGLSKQPVNLHQLIREVVDHFDLILSECRGYIDLKLNAKNPLIEADETHLSNVFKNLIDNAIKYSNSRPNIVITSADTEKGVRFSITDQGIGMDSETKKHIFERFYRAQSADEQQIDGFGLGLSYVKNIVEDHNGWINLKSKPNKGSTFTILLPVGET